jgi:hypothetical protein
VNESIDVLVWREHERWLHDRPCRWIARERWTDADWLAARCAADEAWDRHRSNLYVYDAERALREQHYRRTDARLAFEVSHGVEWLLGVLARTHIDEMSKR